MLVLISMEPAALVQSPSVPMTIKSFFSTMFGGQASDRIFLTEHFLLKDGPLRSMGRYRGDGSVITGHVSITS